MRLSALLACFVSYAAAAPTLPAVLSRAGPVRSESVALRNLDTAHQYSLLYSVREVGAINPDAKIAVELRQGATILVSKTLHAGDPDYYCQFRIAQPGETVLRVTAS